VVSAIFYPLSLKHLFLKNNHQHQKRQQFSYKRFKLSTQGNNAVADAAKFGKKPTETKITQYQIKE
jgi:hypothetical protein